MRLKRFIWYIGFVCLCLCLFVCGASAETDDAELEEIYADIREAILTGADEVDLHHYQIPRNEIGEIFEAFRWENPEIAFCLTSGVEYSYSTEDNTIITVALKYDDKDSVTARYEWLDAETDEILSAVDATWSDLQKLLWINDYVCDRLRYELTTDYRNAYDVLQYGEGVCEGYTCLFNLLAKKCGIAVSYCYSDELVHVWSMVKLDGEWYHIDVTWNDNRVSIYEYFLLSDGANRAAHSDTYFEAYARHTATDTRYDRAFWREGCNSSFVFIDGKTYGIYNDQLIKVDLNTLRTEAFFALPDVSWKVPNQPNVYVKTFYDLAAVGDMLIYNLPNEVYGYSLSTGRVARLHTSAEQTEIYYVRAIGQTLRLGFCQQLETDVIYHGEVRLQDVFPVPYYLDEALYTVRTYYRGWPLTLPEAPTRPHYTFVGWSAEEGTIVNGPMQVRGTYLLADNVSEITFLFDGEVFERVWIERGAAISLPTADPHKESDDYFDYTFASWEGYQAGMTATQSHMTFTANFDSAKRIYIVTYLVDGEVFFEQQVEAGTPLTYYDRIPQKAAIHQFHYKFTGWVGAPAGKEVTKDITLEATFERINTEGNLNGEGEQPWTKLMRDAVVLIVCVVVGVPVLVALVTVIVRSRRRY